MHWGEGNRSAVCETGERDQDTGPVTTMESGGVIASSLPAHLSDIDGHGGQRGAGGSALIASAAAGDEIGVSLRIVVSTKTCAAFVLSLAGDEGIATMSLQRRGRSRGGSRRPPRSGTAQARLVSVAANEARQLLEPGSAAHSSRPPIIELDAARPGGNLHPGHLINSIDLRTHSRSSTELSSTSRYVMWLVSTPTEPRCQASSSGTRARSAWLPPATREGAQR